MPGVGAGMTAAPYLLADGFDRVRGAVHRAVEGLGPDQLAARIAPGANTVAWLVWHLTRIQDDHVAGVAGTGQAWTEAGWDDRFGLPFHPAATGYGHTTDEVSAVVVPSGSLLVDYHDDVHRRTAAFLGRLTDGDLERIVDRSWDPPVTLGVRLVSVISDGLQHAGQAAFVRGILLRT